VILAFFHLLESAQYTRTLPDTAFSFFFVAYICFWIEGDTFDHVDLAHKRECSILHNVPRTRLFVCSEFNESNRWLKYLHFQLAREPRSVSTIFSISPTSLVSSFQNLNILVTCRTDSSQAIGMYFCNSAHRVAARRTNALLVHDLSISHVPW